jgi:hypothetical protein
LSEGNTKSCADVLKNPIKVEDNRREEKNVPHTKNLPNKDKIMKTFPSTWNDITGTKILFLAIITLVMKRKLCSVPKAEPHCKS